MSAAECEHALPCRLVQARGGPSRVPAEVLVKRKKRNKGVEGWEVVRARGHLDEVLELKGQAAGGASSSSKPGEPGEDSGMGCCPLHKTGCRGT